MLVTTQSDVARTLYEVDYPYMVMPDHMPRHPDDPDFDARDPESRAQTAVWVTEVEAKVREQSVAYWLERFRELDAQKTDLEDSVGSIKSAIAKLNRTCRERFRDAYDRVNEAFQTAYPQLVGGGDARLALTGECAAVCQLHPSLAFSYL